MGHEKTRPVNLKYPQCDQVDCTWRSYCLFPVTPCKAQMASSDAYASAESAAQPAGRSEAGRQGTLLEVCNFNSISDPAVFYRARMTGCSAGQIEFLSAQHFKKDTPVFIRVRQCDEMRAQEKLPAGVKSAGLARVKSSRPARSEKEALFMTTAAYY